MIKGTHLFMLFTLFFLMGQYVNSQTLCNSPDTIFRVLHFTKTTGYDHGTRTVSNAMFTEIAAEKGFNLVDSENPSIFDNLDTLNTFSVIIFSNTSGNSIFNTAQKNNFESYINGGGSYIGIHAASDTYRTGWAFYNELVGGIVQSGPNHTSQNHVNFMDHEYDHSILDGIPDPWEKQEEYYYWDLNGGMNDTTNFVTLLKVRQTGSNSYDRARPVTWFRIFPSGARSFYTALGHKTNNYQDSGNEFRMLMENAVCWTSYDKDVEIGGSSAVEIEQGELKFSEPGAGLVITSPNGNCYRITVSDTGVMSTKLVLCKE